MHIHNDGGIMGVCVGKPNAGKTTLLNALTGQFNGFKLVSLGDLCREEARKQTETSKRAIAHMQATGSTLWPTECIAKVLSGGPDRRDFVHMMFDGLLRHPEQVPLTIELVHSFGFNRLCIFLVETSDEICIQRARERGRPDDVDINRRLGEFHEETLPAIRTMVSCGAVEVDKVTIDSTDMIGNATRWAGVIAGILNLKPKA